MRPFAPLTADTARCHGFTCPHDRDTCRRFTERGLAAAHTNWTNGDFVESLIAPGTTRRDCKLQIPVKPASAASAT